MTQQELSMCRQAALLFRQVKEENEQLRRALNQAQFIDQRMDEEDAQAFALVARNHPERAAAAIHMVQKRPFDYDNPDVYEVEGEIVEEARNQPAVQNRPIAYYIRFSIWLVAETVVWICHHFGWVNFIGGLTLAIFVMLLSNIFR